MNDPVAVGDVVAGKYAVQGVLGRGGIGVVVAAEHVTLKRRVALKFLRPELAHVPEVVQRFLREGRAAAQLHSEHVARVLDADTTDAGAPYIVMELLEGRDLAAIVKEQGPLPIETAVDYVMQACEAVAEAHAVGVLHRDLKSSNLFLTRSSLGAPLVKVLDFGLSKIESLQPDAALTSDNHVMGSPHFMSPEQMRSSRDVDARSDIWALGVVLYKLLAGRVPFQGGYLTEVCSAVLSGDAPPLASLRPDVPAGLEEAISRCLRLEREERFASALQLAFALAPFGGAAGAGRAARIERLVAERGGADTSAPLAFDVDGAAPVAAAAVAAPVVLVASAALPAPRGRRRLLVAVVGCLFVLGAFALLRRPSVAMPQAPSAAAAMVSAVAPVVTIEPPPPVAPPSASPPASSGAARIGAARAPATSPPAPPRPTRARPRRPQSDEDVIMDLPH